MSGSGRRILVDHRGGKGVGDLICEMNFYRALHQQEPEAELVSRGSRSLAWGQPLVSAFDETTPEEAFDRVVCLDGDRLAAFTRGKAEALREGRSVFDHFLHHVDLPRLGRPPDLFVLPVEIEELGLEDDGDGGLIIAYSADSKDPDRRWGEERFAELARYLEERHGVSLIELGSGMTGGHLGVGYDAVGAFTLRQSMAALWLADGFLGNHGGLTHMAGALGTPILSPWGSSTPYAAYTYDDLSIAIEPDLSCRHCIWTHAARPECVAVDPMRGRTPCTQLISVEEMLAAADDFVERLCDRRAELRDRKRERLREAREPSSLVQFDPAAAVTPVTHQRIYLGGRNASWGPEHGQDNFVRLQQIVSFPNWADPGGGWRELLSWYVGHVDPESPVALTVTAYPLTGTEIRVLLEEHFTWHGVPERGMPKIMVILGGLGESERQWLINRGVAYFPVPGPYHSPTFALESEVPFALSTSELELYLA
jgi:hypothetical protein